ncbi:MAG: UDP-galactopyranose mutase [Oscillospiraceae bacterium]|jgi:UDP-galactopyranose mutase|nr:UDP-galactopyranose mutase [Oscillospiraceae bacterium]
MAEIITNGYEGCGMGKRYDYLVVGAGLYGAVFAHEMRQRGKRCLVVEKSGHIAGHIYTARVDGIDIHQYGAHIFHTHDAEIWRYMKRFTRFNHYINSPIANYHGEIYNLPFNMNTFNKLWGVATPHEAAAKIEAQRRAAGIETPHKLEEQAIFLVGTDIYEKLIKGYTEKQWGRACTQLPASLIKRLPVRFVYDNNYFDDPYQGIPKDGYTAIVEHMLEGIEVRLNVDYLKERAALSTLAERTLYTGPIDALYDYRYGTLEYRSLRFETEVLDMPNYQGVAVVNYTDAQTPFTRIIEHKHFAFGAQPKTIISREYSNEWALGVEPYYPVNNLRNIELYNRYAAIAAANKELIVGGRLGEYAYYDMDDVVARAIKRADLEPR